MKATIQNFPFVKSRYFLKPFATQPGITKTLASFRCASGRTVRPERIHFSLHGVLNPKLHPSDGETLSKQGKEGVLTTLAFERLAPGLQYFQHVPINYSLQWHGKDDGIDRTTQWSLHLSVNSRNLGLRKVLRSRAYLSGRSRGKFSGKFVSRPNELVLSSLCQESLKQQIEHLSEDFNSLRGKFDKIVGTYEIEYDIRGMQQPVWNVAFSILPMSLSPSKPFEIKNISKGYYSEKIETLFEETAFVVGGGDLHNLNDQLARYGPKGKRAIEIIRALHSALYDTFDDAWLRLGLIKNTKVPWPQTIFRLRAKKGPIDHPNTWCLDLKSETAVVTSNPQAVILTQKLVDTSPRDLGLPGDVVKAMKKNKLDFPNALAVVRSSEDELLKLLNANGLPNSRLQDVKEILATKNLQLGMRLSARDI